MKKSLLNLCVVCVSLMASWSMTAQNVLDSAHYGFEAPFFLEEGSEPGYWYFTDQSLLTIVNADSIVTVPDGVEDVKCLRFTCDGALASTVSAMSLKGSMVFDKGTYDLSFLFYKKAGTDVTTVKFRTENTWTAIDFKIDTVPEETWVRLSMPYSQVVDSPLDSLDRFRIQVLSEYVSALSTDTFYIDDVQMTPKEYEGIEPSDNPTMYETFYSFEEETDLWWIANNVKSFVSISDEKAATGTSSLKFDVADYSSSDVIDLTLSGLRAKVPDNATKAYITLEQNSIYEIYLKAYISGSVTDSLRLRLRETGGIDGESITNISDIGISLSSVTERDQWVTIGPIEYIHTKVPTSTVVVQVTALKEGMPATGAGTLYIDDIVLNRTADYSIPGSSEVANTIFYSFDYSTVGSGWWIDTNKRDYISFTEEQAYDGARSLKFSFVSNSSAPETGISASSLNDEPAAMIKLENDSTYKVSFMTYLVDDAPDSVYIYYRGSVCDSLANLGLNGYTPQQVFKFYIGDITERNQWVKVEEFFHYTAENLKETETLYESSVNGSLRYMEAATMQISLPKAGFDVTSRGGCTVYIDNVLMEKAAAAPSSLNQLKTIDIDVYPNPSQGVLNIRLDENAQLTLCDISGKTILTQSITSGLNTIDVQREKAGVYFLSVKTDNGLSIQKLIVE